MAERIRVPWTERFWAKVDVRGPDECWPWTAAADRLGYGRINSDGVPLLAHRCAWILTNGPIPDGMCVCHGCDNPPCCNGRHLFLGTKADNNADMAAKGRAAQRGEGNVHAKLTERDVLAIRRLHGSGRSQVSIAREFGVAPQTILRVINRLTWAHV